MTKEWLLDPLNIGLNLNQPVAIKQSVSILQITMMYINTIKRWD